VSRYGPPGGGGGGGFRIGPTSTPLIVKQVMLLMGGVFLMQVVLQRVGFSQVVELGALTGSRFWSGMIWQPITAVFLHDDRDLWHLVGNLFLLWMFGSNIATQLGPRRFATLFFGGGAAAALLKMVLVGALHLAGYDSIPFLAWSTASVGASGAVFVLLAWYCFSWPDQEINVLLLPFVFTARQMLPLWFLLEFGFAADGIDHAIHLAGAIVGWLAITGYKRRLNGPPKTPRAPRKPRHPHLRLVGGADPDEPMFH